MTADRLIGTKHLEDGERNLDGSRGVVPISPANAIKADRLAGAMGKRNSRFGTAMHPMIVSSFSGFPASPAIFRRYNKGEMDYWRKLNIGEPPNTNLLLISTNLVVGGAG